MLKSEMRAFPIRKDMYLKLSENVVQSTDGAELRGLDSNDSFC